MPPGRILMTARGPESLNDKDKALFASIDVRSALGAEQAIEQGADVNARWYRESTPLHHAAGQPLIVRRLLKGGADPNVADDLGRTPLHAAVGSPETNSADRYEVLTDLLKAGAGPNARRKTGETPLHDAATIPREAATPVNQLLRAGADPKLRDELGNTPLHYAARHPAKRRALAVDHLLNAGATVNVQNHSGNTPLHMAVAGAGEEQAKTIGRLLADRPDLTLRNANGQTALELSASLKNPVARTILERHTFARNLYGRRSKTAQAEPAHTGGRTQQEVKTVASQTPTAKPIKTQGKPRSSKLGEYHEKVADLVIKQIKQGVAPWQKPWKPGEKGLPENLASGNRYSGGNSLHLAAVAQQRGYSDNRWGTLNQINRQGGRIRKGERGVSVLWVQQTRRVKATDEKGKPVLDSDGKPTYREGRLNPPHVKTYTVFNAEQADRLAVKDEHRQLNRSWKAHQQAENVLKASGVPIHNRNGDKAYYNLSQGRDCPTREIANFLQPQASTTRRLCTRSVTPRAIPASMNRESLQKGVEAGFGSEAYAKEELRAEISAMMTGERIGVGHNPSRGAAYVENWVAVLKKDPLEIRHAAGDAQKMSDYVIRRGREREAERPAGTKQIPATGAPPQPSREHSEPGRAPAQNVAARAAAPAPALKRSGGPSR